MHTTRQGWSTTMSRFPHFRVKAMERISAAGSSTGNKYFKAQFLCSGSLNHHQKTAFLILVLRYSAKAEDNLTGKKKKASDSPE